MMQYRIEITNLAEEDLENTGDYIAYELKNPTAAVNTVNAIRKQINSLVNFPERNELDEDEVLAELGVRKDYYRNYKIYYIIDKDAIYIVRIQQKTVKVLRKMALYTCVLFHNNQTNTKKLQESKFSQYSLSKQLRMICIFIQD